MPKPKADPLSRDFDSIEARTTTVWDLPYDSFFNGPRSSSTFPVLPHSDFTTIPDYALDYDQNNQISSCNMDEVFTGWRPDASMLNSVDYGYFFQELESSQDSRND
ncbi:hypothetical protein MMC15_000630 [Xylographa vitiligo]|nr:hypothetical protein [Xylographa vitiligo]